MDYVRSLEAFRRGHAKAEELKLVQFMSRFEPAIQEVQSDVGGKDEHTSDLAKA
jgi:hypothetical protein